MKTIGVIFLLSITFISCNNTGFSQEFKENFTEECITTAQVNISQNEAERYCNCALGLVLAKYSSESEAERKIYNMSINDVTEFFQPCRR
jgi:hypothetical protein|tara:strand:+ start:285 stop:554 length:270 start_codon:yes stop_codon:yes gene_type:complete